MPSTATVRSRELEPETFIPYVRHVDERVIALDSRALMVIIKLEGVSFETADTLDLNALHRDLNTLYRNIADERLALWTHVIRRRDNEYPDGEFSNAFSRTLNGKYRNRMISEDLFRNDLYLSLVWHPGKDPAERVAAFLAKLRKARRRGVELDEDALKHLDDTIVDVTAGLKRFGPRVLTLQEHDGLIFSEPSEMLHQLVGGRREPVPLTEGRVSSAIYSDRVIVGRETVEIRHEGSSRYAGMFGFKEYPARTRPGMFDGLLTVPYELILTQSFSFLSKSDAKTVMGRKQNQMVSAGDKAGSQLEELDETGNFSGVGHGLLGQCSPSASLCSERQRWRWNGRSRSRGRTSSATFAGRPFVSTRVGNVYLTAALACRLRTARRS